MEMTVTKPLCIYHGACDDGFAAAWCVRKALGDDVEFYPGIYQKEPPPHEGRDVIFVDFSYKRPVLDRMTTAARSILILDHHKTAQEDLADLPAPDGSWSSYQQTVEEEVAYGLHQPRALFDRERSGAALAWDYFIGGERPKFIEYIQDRDLWLKRLPGGDEFTIALRSYPQDFDTWSALINEDPNGLIEEGLSIQRYYRLRVEELKRSAYPAIFEIFDEHDRRRLFRAMIANAPYFAASEVAGELALTDGFDFGACYFEVEGGRYQYSLRSRGIFDVSNIARQFGGGGHKAAAGFTADIPIHQRILSTKPLWP